MLPEDNIQSQDFKCDTEARLGVKEARDCPLGPRCSLTAAVFIFVFIPTLWSSNSMLTQQAAMYVRKIEIFNSLNCFSTSKSGNPSFELFYLS